MKIVLFTVNHIYANQLVKDVIEKYKSDVKLIVEPKVLLKNKNIVQTIFFYLKTSGFKYLYYQFSKMFVYKILSFFETLLSTNSKNKFYNFEKIAHKHKVKLLKLTNINSRLAINKIKAIHPDVVVSILFPQIITSDLLNLLKKRIINFHPAYLPNYRGISPIFWSLLNKEKYAGYSIHYINEGIDSGTILSQNKVKIIKTDSEDSLYMRCVKEGSIDLIQIINKFAGKTKPKGIIKKGGSYHSFPDKKSVNMFLNKGNRFYDLKHLIWN